MHKLYTSVSFPGAWPHYGGNLSTGMRNVHKKICALVLLCLLFGLFYPGEPLSDVPKDNEVMIDSPMANPTGKFPSDKWGKDLNAAAHAEHEDVYKKISDKGKEYMRIMEKLKKAKDEIKANRDVIEPNKNIHKNNHDEPRETKNVLQNNRNNLTQNDLNKKTNTSKLGFDEDDKEELLLNRINQVDKQEKVDSDLDNKINGPSEKDTKRDELPNVKENLRIAIGNVPAVKENVAEKAEQSEKDLMADEMKSNKKHNKESMLKVKIAEDKHNKGVGRKKEVDEEAQDLNRMKDKNEVI